MRKRTLVLPTRSSCALRVGVAFGMLAGCGDVHGFKTHAGSIEPNHGPIGHACFDGSPVKLVRYSSDCGPTTKSLESDVHEGMVFSAEEVASLGSPCENGPAPALEVLFDMDSHSMVVDFSQVSEGDRFRAAVFDGYIFDVVLEESNGILVNVTVDREASSLDFNDSDLDFCDAYISMNFQGMAYDEGGLIKIDLDFAHATPGLGDEARDCGSATHP